MTTVTLEYIWLDGTKPTPLLRSKTKILKTNADGYPYPSVQEAGDAIGKQLPGKLATDWGFDGSSTNQASGDSSDCVLKPVRDVPNPLMKDVPGIHRLVLCEVYKPDGTPHESNTRAKLAAVADEHAAEEYMFGFEQEYTLLQNGHPLGFPMNLNHEPPPQGQYYCGVGAENAFGRKLVQEHMLACIEARLMICGINAEVMPGQWEFQIGAADALLTADHLILARWLLARLGEEHGIEVTRAAKPKMGDWNGAGCHTNVSTKAMREDTNCRAIAAACLKLGEGDRPRIHVENYGDGIKSRLTGEHETCKYNQFKFDVADRGASIRIPAHVHEQGKGYIEDRRPNANCDPYTVARLLMKTISS